MTYTSSSYSSGISETVLLLVWLFSSCMVKEFWLTRWLVAACALLSAFELARRLSRAQAEARALAVKDRVMAENYRSLLEKHHDTAVMRLVWKYQ